MAQGTCSVCGAEGRIVRGWCLKHYQRVTLAELHGDAFYVRPAPPPKPLECSVDWCHRPVYRGNQVRNRCYRAAAAAAKPGCIECGAPVVARGLCDKHYSRWRVANGPECSLEGCPAPRSHRGWCMKHYSAWLRYGGSRYTSGRKLAPGLRSVATPAARLKQEAEFATKPFGIGKRTRASHCLECARAEQKERRLEHADKVNAREREKYALNPSKKRASKAAYRVAQS